jgi:hypothetical protein
MTHSLTQISVPALGAGIVGAVSLNLIHESGRHLIRNAPHVDQIAMRAIGQYILIPFRLEVSLKNLRRIALAGDLISNSLYYALVVGASRRQEPKAVWQRSLFWGVAAGAGAVLLPPRMKLGQQFSRNFPLTAALTVAWYTIGSLVAAGVFSLRLSKEPRPVGL